METGDKEVLKENFADQLLFLRQLQDFIKEEAARQNKEHIIDAYESAEVDKLNAALAEAELKYREVLYNRMSSWFQAEYIDLDGLMEMCRPLLAANGLVVTFFTEVGENIILHTRLRHSSGQWIESRARFISSRDDLKTQESALNHLKRQQVMSLLNLTLKGDVMDDDAVEDMREKRNELHEGTPVDKASPREHSNTTIDSTELRELNRVLEDEPDILEEVLKYYRIMHLADMPRAKYQFAIDKIREIKNLKKTLSQK